MTDRFVLAHGFTQTARSWQRFEGRLRSACPTVDDILAVDMPGHGTSPPATGDLWTAADHLVGEGATGTYIGYSMGGRVALHAALAHPGAVERLVLIGATAGIDDADERVARRNADDALAERIERGGVDAFLDDWLSNPLFAGLDDSTDQRQDRRRNSAAGLASSLRHHGTGCQEPLWARIGDIRCPTLLLVGERDHKFREIADRLERGIERSELVVVPGSGHTVHLEQPAATVDAIVDFLASS